MGEHHREHPAVGAASGLAASAGGYTLKIAWIPSESNLKGRLDFWILDRNGRAVGDFDEQHERRMHLIVVRHDLSHYQHLHPSMSADGTWSIPLILPEPGIYRVFADFAIEGESLTLGDDLATPSDYEPRQLPDPADVARADGYEVVLDTGTVATGAETELISASPVRDRKSATWILTLGLWGTWWYCAKVTSPTCMSTPWAALARGSRSTPHSRAQAATGSSSSLLMKGQYIRPAFTLEVPS
jgi:hypothetical protein